jgi:hypothetical protein
MPNEFERRYANLVKSKVALDIMQWAAEYTELLEQGHDPQYARVLMDAKLLGIYYVPRPVELKPIPEPGDPLATVGRYQALKQLHTHASRFAKEVKRELKRMESNANPG